MQDPRVWLGIARIYVALISIGQFMGQAYFGHFSVPSTVTGVCGLIASAVGARPRAHKSIVARVAVLASVALGLVGVVLEAGEYYSLYDVPGNDFAWELRGPFVVSLLYIGFSAMKLSNLLYRDSHAA